MNKSLNNFAIIPARFGSKRIKKKNIKTFNSKPMIEWTFRLLKKSKLFQGIALTSENERILKLGKKIGFDILIKRPNHLANDFAGTHPVINHAIRNLKKKIQIDNVCCVYPCNPFLQISDLKKAFRLIKNNKKKFLLTVSKYTHPIERAFSFNQKNNRIKFVNQKFLKYRTQDVTDKYFDAGQFYLAQKNVWLKKKLINRIGIKIPNWRMVDIDTTEDWERAELFYNFLKNKKLIK